jgi:hypothetical protein
VGPGDPDHAGDGQPAELGEDALAFMVRAEAERVLAWWPARLERQRNPNGWVSKRRARQLAAKRRRAAAVDRAGGDAAEVEPTFNLDERNWCRRGFADLEAAVGFARRALDALARDDVQGAVAAGFQMAVHETRGAALFVADEEGNRARRRGAGARNEAQKGEAATYKAAIARALDQEPALREEGTAEVMRQLQRRGVLPSDGRRGASERSQKRWISDVVKAKAARANR